MNKLEDPIFVEYWKQQFMLEDFQQRYCIGCQFYFWCWHYGEGYCYHPEIIFKVCSHKEIRKTIYVLNNLTREAKDPFYFGATAEEYIQLEKRFKIKTAKKQFVYLAEFGLFVIKSKSLDPRKISIINKIIAITGFNLTIGFCRKHKLYYKRDECTFNVLYICPKCFEERF